MELKFFPDYYKRYSWDGKHKLFGYPPDSYPDFRWISSLEKRFLWLRENSRIKNTASKYLIQEMIEWGGSQNGVLQKFNDGSGEANLLELVQQVIVNLDEPEAAISSALKFPGLGLTYASKLLRFMEPEKYGALDSRIRNALLKNNLLSKINDGSIKSMTNGYLEFLGLLKGLARDLERQKIVKPICNLSNSSSWNASQIEMALFCWAENESSDNLSVEDSSVLIGSGMLDETILTSRIKMGQSNGLITDKQPSKRDKTKLIFQEMKQKRCSRKEIIDAFIEKADMTEKGAATYYQDLNKSLNNK